MQSKQALTPVIRVSVEKITEFILKNRKKRAWMGMEKPDIIVSIICAIGRNGIIVVTNEKDEIEGVATGKIDYLYKVIMVDNILVTTKRALKEIITTVRELWKDFDFQGERNDGLRRYENGEKFLKRLERF